MARPAVPAPPPPGWGPRPPAVATITLGAVVLNVDREAAVVGRVLVPPRAAAGGEDDGHQVCEAAEALVAAGAVAVELPVAPGADPEHAGSVVAALVERLDVPVLVRGRPTTSAASPTRTTSRSRRAPAAVVGRHPHPARLLACLTPSRVYDDWSSTGDGSPHWRRSARRGRGRGIPRPRIIGRRRPRPRQDRAAVARAAAGSDRGPRRRRLGPLFLSGPNKRFLGDLLAIEQRTLARGSPTRPTLLGIALGCRCAPAHDVRWRPSPRSWWPRCWPPVSETA